ncbi:magnesium transporter MgtE N-terminal domain-containing protein [Aneurinibacillus terranovensis]|uniref:magnesium transporter MgtE N-terminal domain-containing protein n=1 Tax=Aneurinibacillus terranovensis TaxID=278991 RepID=UPI0004005AC3|nr:hypothetical protein [Aneurinibacillus terranovensis]
MKESTEEERSYSKLEWFFYIIFIPILFTLVLSGIIAQMFGYNVVGSLAKMLSSVPVIQKLIPDSAVSHPNSSSQKAPTQQDEQAQKLKDELNAKNQEVQNLKNQVNLDQKKMQQNQQQIADAKASAATAKQAIDADRQQQISGLAKIYTSMSASKAAPIMEKLTPQEAVLVLKSMKSVDASAILAKMDPQKAADLSALLKDTTLTKDADTAALQQRIQNLTGALSKAQKNSSTLPEMVNTFSTMDATSAAKILLSMDKTNENQALAILARMDVQKRSQILSSMTNDLGQIAMAAKISQKLLAQ